MNPDNSDTPFWSEGVCYLPQFFNYFLYKTKGEKNVKIIWYDDNF